MARNYKLERLQSGESFITSEKGNSMVPLIKSGQKHMLAPATSEDVEVGDIAYCKVKGNWYTHLVTAKDDKKGCQISNNKGNINGWSKSVYGVVVEVIGGKHKRKKVKKMANKKMFIVSVPNCDAFFDQDGIYIKSIHDNDGEYRSEYFNGLFEHFGIEVERFKLSKELDHKVDVGMYADKELSDFLEDIKKEIKG
jgi:hypothetical protein